MLCFDTPTVCQEVEGKAKEEGKAKPAAIQERSQGVCCQGKGSPQGQAGTCCRLVLCIQ